MTIVKTKGRLILKEIRFDQAYKRTAIKNNKTSCKVTLPRELEGKTVYVIVDESEES